MLTTISVPNLVSGISQQPPPLRLSSSLEDSLNQWPSVVSGLSPRFPTEHIGDLGISVTDGAIGFLIDRNDSYRYIGVIIDGDLKVFTLDGVEQTVSFPNGKAYLRPVGNNPANKFRFLTFGDTTFIVNRDIVVSEHFIGEDGTAPFTPDGTVADYASLPAPSVTYADLVYQATDSGYYYRCELQPGDPEIVSWVYQSSSNGGGWDGTSLPSDPIAGATFKLFTYSDEYVDYYDIYEAQVTQASTPDYYEWKYRALSQLTSVTNGRLDPQDRATVHVTNSISNSNYNIYINNTLEATFLTANGTSAADSVEGTDVIAEELRSDLAGNGYTVERIGSTIAISGLMPTDTITVTGTNGDKFMRCYRDVVKSFSDLPPNEVQGRIVMVKGAPEDSQDDYYVIFEEDRWVETYAYNSLTELAPNNMPHVLVRNANGTWTFKEHAWGRRNAGDEDSNPLPSFVGYRLEDMFQYTNRIGFITEDNVILSESNEFENYFRTTIATLLDSDPVDMAVISPMNDALRHAVPFNRDLLIMGDLSQHRLSYQQLVGPKNIQVTFTTSYNCSKTVEPLNMGNSIYFMDDRPVYENARLMEYFVKPGQNSIDDAQELSDPVPTLIPSGIFLLDGSPRLNLAVMATTASPTKLYIYKFYWSGDKKVQNAWVVWDFPDCTRLFWAGFSGDYLYVLIERGGSVFLERLKVTEDPANRIGLDRQVSEAGLSVVPGASQSEVTLPYSTGEQPSCVVLDNGTFIVLDMTNTTGNTYTVDYDLSLVDGVWAGVPFESSATLSIPYIRAQRGGGEMVTEESPLMVKDLRVSFANLERIEARLEVRGKTYEKTVAYPSQEAVGTIHLPMATNNYNAKITLWSTWPTGYQLTGAEWRGQYAPKSRRT